MTGGQLSRCSFRTFRPGRRQSAKLYERAVSYLPNEQAKGATIGRLNSDRTRNPTFIEQGAISKFDLLFGELAFAFVPGIRQLYDISE